MFWRSLSTVDAELAWLPDATSCTDVHTSIKLRHHRKQQADLPNPCSDLGFELGLTFLCKGGRGRVQAEKSGQRALVSQSESLQCAVSVS